MDIRENVHSARKNINDLFAHKERTAARCAGISLVLAVLCLLLGGISVYFSRQVRVVPYIVQVDEHGYEVAIGPLQASAVTDERIIISRLGTFVQNWRTVVSDVKAQQGMVEWVYSSIPKDSAAQRKINEWYSENNPYETYYISKATRQVNIKTILKVSEVSWRVEWTETSFEGTDSRKGAWTGIFTLASTPPTDINDVIRNPLGIYIKDFSVSPDFRTQHKLGELSVIEKQLDEKEDGE